MAPVCWLIGIPWQQAVTAGGLMGMKTILNEFIAYLELSKLPADALDAALALDHALCAVRLCQFRFARHHDCAGSAPWRRSGATTSSSLGLKSIVSGTLATCLMGAMVGCC